MSSVTTSNDNSLIATPPPSKFLLANLPHSSKNAKHPPFYTVKPSTVIKTTALFQFEGDDTHRSLRTGLAAEDARLRRRLRLEKLVRKRASAEAAHIERESKEACLLRHAAEEGQSWASLMPDMAIALARAARDTLVAQQKLLHSQQDEYKQRLLLVDDEENSLFYCIKEAKFQVGQLLTDFITSGIPFDYSDKYSHLTSACEDDSMEDIENEDGDEGGDDDKIDEEDHK